MTSQRGMIHPAGGEAATHSIKLTGRVYRKLCEVQQPRETFSEAVGRMIGGYQQWDAMNPRVGRR
ncbi:hypothetical protein ES708_34264 [subsurface metagenome]